MEIKQISWEIFMWILGVEGLNNMDTYAFDSPQGLA